MTPGHSALHKCPNLIPQYGSVTMLKASKDLLSKCNQILVWTEALSCWFYLFHVAFCSLIESMFYALLCILTVSALRPILHALQPRVAVKCAEAQRQGSCLPLVVGTRSWTVWSLSGLMGGAIAYPRHRVASANLVNNAESWININQCSAVL